MSSNVWVVGAAAVAAAAMILAVQGVYWMVVSRRDAQSRELSRRLGTLAEKETSPLFRLNQPRDRGGPTAWIEEQIRQSGVPYGVAGVLQRVAGFAIGGLVIMLLVFKSPLGVIGVMAGAIPLLLLGRAAEERARRLTEQLPDALDLLARSLAAGHGISEAMRMAAEELPMPLAGEFGRVYEENNLGRDFRECVQNLCTRNPKSFDLRIFASSVLLQRDTGGNLIEILYAIANTIRQRFVFQGKLGALTSEARFTAWILGGLPFVIGTLIAFSSPKYLVPLWTDPWGIVGSIFFASWFMLGLFVMRELSKVEL